MTRQLDRAIHFLRMMLRAGPRKVADLKPLAQEKGLHWKTVERAKPYVQVVAVRPAVADDGWTWMMP